MPNYVYKCISCEKTVNIFHSFSDKPTDCGLCGAADSLLRDYSAPFNIANKATAMKKEVGQVVRQHIEETREDIKRQKEEFIKGVVDD
jgi:putative FmdB family regulatory protein